MLNSQIRGSMTSVCLEVRARQSGHVENRVQVQDVEDVRADGDPLPLVQVERLLEAHVELMADRQPTAADGSTFMVMLGIVLPPVKRTCAPTE